MYRLSQEIPQSSCKQCGAPLPYGNSVCSHCGINALPVVETYDFCDQIVDSGIRHLLDVLAGKLGVEYAISVYNDDNTSSVLQIHVKDVITQQFVAAGYIHASIGRYNVIGHDCSGSGPTYRNAVLSWKSLLGNSGRIYSLSSLSKGEDDSFPHHNGDPITSLEAGILNHPVIAGVLTDILSRAFRTKLVEEERALAADARRRQHRLLHTLFGGES